MTLQSDINEQRRRHKGVLHLVRQSVAERTQELAHEISLEHEISMHMQGLMGALTNLCLVASQDESGFAMVRQELADLGITHNRLGLLISALQARKE